MSYLIYIYLSFSTFFLNSPCIVYKDGILMNIGTCLLCLIESKFNFLKMSQYKYWIQISVLIHPDSFQVVLCGRILVSGILKFLKPFADLIFDRQKPIHTSVCFTQVCFRLCVCVSVCVSASVTPLHSPFVPGRLFG